MRSLKRVIGALALVTLFTSPVSALEPVKSTMVDTAIPAAPSTYRQEDETMYIGISGCRNSIGVATKYTGTFEMNLNPAEEEGAVRRFENAYFYSVARGVNTSPTCPADCTLIDEDEEVIISDDPASYYVRARATFEDLTGVASVDDCEGFDSEFFIQVHLLRNLVDSDTAELAGVKFIVDTIRPTPPPSFTATATENQVTVTWELAADDDVERYGVYYSKTEFAGGVIADGSQASKFFTSEGGRTSGTFDVSLEPGETLYMAMVSSDETGNNSPMGDVVTAEAIATSDFWAAYKDAGGSEEGGCASTSLTPSPWLLVFAFVAFWTSRRKR